MVHSSGYAWQDMGQRLALMVGHLYVVILQLLLDFLHNRTSC